MEESLFDVKNFKSQTKEFIKRTNFNTVQESGTAEIEGTPLHTLNTKDLKKIKTSNFYKKKHIIIIHRENDKVDNLDGMLNLIMIRKYGRSKILFAKFI